MSRTALPQFCLDCAVRKSCARCHDEAQRDECPYFKEDVKLSYRNSEGYSDPTTYFALRNIEREERAKRKTARQQERHS